MNLHSTNRNNRQRFARAREPARVHSLANGISRPERRGRERGGGRLRVASGPLPLGPLGPLLVRGGHGGRFTALGGEGWARRGQQTCACGEYRTASQGEGEKGNKDCHLPINCPPCFHLVLISSSDLPVTGRLPRYSTLSPTHPVRTDKPDKVGELCASLWLLRIQVSVLSVPVLGTVQCTGTVCMDYPGKYSMHPRWSGRNCLS